MSNRRLLVVDDSATIRALIAQTFDRQPDIRVVGYVKSADEAAQALEDLFPDVMTLDITMPGMDGLTFLEQVMTSRPMPIIMVSSSSSKGSELCDRAIDLGASACFDKARILSDRGAFLKAIRTAKRGSPVRAPRPGGVNR